MAGRSLKYGGHRLFSPAMAGGAAAAAASDEFDESDVWGYEVAETRQAEHRKPAPGRKKVEVGDRGSAASSLPVNIPDWSKILREEYRGHGHSNGGWAVAEEEEEERDRYGVVIPPHELLCRNRTASLSVHEGIGRTLKGRDLSRVRNAIWEKTGFQD